MTEESAVRYEHPRILLIDMDDECLQALTNEGYNAQGGTYGRPFKVPRSDDYKPVPFDSQLPGFLESEVLIVDVGVKTVLGVSPGEKFTTDGEYDWWQKCNEGKIDPRPRGMLMYKDNAQRILAHGGIFVVFADSCSEPDQEYARLVRGRFYVQEAIHASNWSFLPLVSETRITVKADYGSSIRIENPSLDLGRFLSRHIKGSKFSCVLERGYFPEDAWHPLAVNKYDDVVAALMGFENKGRPPGCVLILPRIKDRSSLLVGLMKEIFPELSPNLFPEHEGMRWVHRSEYEIPHVLQLKTQIEDVKQESERQVAELNGEIASEEAENGWMYDLLRGTDDVLKQAVQKALSAIGFMSVIDVDEELKCKGTDSRKEDLRIDDAPDKLLIETKGISGRPCDEDCLAVGKYVTMRMREWKTTDVKGLSIINHRRNIPPLERDNSGLFRKEILEAAVGQHIGLLTAWDLYVLLRNFQRHGWSHEQIRDLFHGNGRIEPIPTHYQPIGTVEDYWEKVPAVGFTLQHTALKVGDRIAFRLTVEYEEQRVDSMHVDGAESAVASIGDRVSVQTHLYKQQARNGVQIYRVG